MYDVLPTWRYNNLQPRAKGTDNKCFVLNDTSLMEHFPCTGTYLGPALGLSLEILSTPQELNYYYHHHFTDQKTEALETYPRSTGRWAVEKLGFEPRSRVCPQSVATSISLSLWRPQILEPVVNCPGQHTGSRRAHEQQWKVGATPCHSELIFSKFHCLLTVGGQCLTTFSPVYQ